MLNRGPHLIGGSAINQKHNKGDQGDEADDLGGEAKAVIATASMPPGARQFVESLDDGSGPAALFQFNAATSGEAGGFFSKSPADR
jgi:hypothetical protein